MSVLRFAWRSVGLLLWLLGGLLSTLLLFPVIGFSRRLWMIQNWSKGLLAICGVKVVVQGSPVLSGSVLWVSNHCSWLDIFVLDKVRATCFVAKSEIRKWPVIGWLVSGAGTVYIDRTHRHAIKGVSEQMNQRFVRSEAVGLFPEGTTSAGDEVKPFHASLFEAAIRVKVDIQPVALRYYQHGERSARFAFTGDQSLMANIWILLGSRGAMVECEFLTVLPAEYCAEVGRAVVATETWQQVHAAVVEKT